jgi:hypothetical protein
LGAFLNLVPSLAAFQPYGCRAQCAAALCGSRTPQPFASADGATIYPPAYQQVLKGLPAVNYAARDIVYRPRNVRAHRVYGFSPVQQVLMTVNIALRRQLWQLDYFTEGSIPDALIGVPQGWTPDQIKQFQDYWDTEFAGDLAKRRRAKFVPGETAAKVVQTKEPQHKDDFDEWLARIICFAFSVPPQWATKVMNRATAENHSAQSEEEGLEPTKEWVKDLIDEIVAEEFASPDLELHWLDEDEGDPETVLEGRVKLGAVTLNEMRDALGLDPFDNAAADRPMVLTATGFVPIEANAGGEGASANVQGANTQRVPAVQKYSPDQPRVPADNPDGGQWTTEPGTQLAANDSSQRKPIDLRDEEAPIGRGHAIREHVGKSDAELSAQMIRKTARIANVYDRREGSFDSIESANDLVNRVLDAPENAARIADVVSGKEPVDLITSDFGFDTGRELYRLDPDTEPYMRVTNGVGVVIRFDPTKPRGYSIVTAYPRTGPVEQ